MLTADQRALLGRLGANWPAVLKLDLSDETPAGFPTHPLGLELTALAEGRSVSLPFFSRGKEEVSWFTLAPDDQMLRSAIEDLRSWILPSFGWENAHGPLVLPGESTGAVSSQLLTMSPAGYFRWQTTRGLMSRVITKLRQMRTLEQARPRHTIATLPSLFLLRQEFAAALIVGDRPAAEEAVVTIDRRQLDSADNSLFMRVRLWSRFGEFDRIVNHPELARLLSVRMPHRVCLSILEAFHAQGLASLEDAGRVSEALESYAHRMHDAVHGLIARTTVADPLPARRLLAYRARVLGDAQQARQLLCGPADVVIAALLSSLAQEAEPPPSLEAQFLEARKQCDWKAVQELGEPLVAGHPEYVSILRRSLEFRPNPSLGSVLDSREPGQAPQPRPAEAPRTWLEWLTQLRGGDAHSLELFLEEREETTVAALRPAEIQQLCDGLEELYTDPATGQDLRLRRTLMSGLVELVDDFVKEPGFPRDGLADVYFGLYRLWGGLKRGSAFPPDAQVLLELAEAALQFGRCDESEVLQLLKDWWDARPVKALLPFLLGAVELLDRLDSSGQCENFWLLAGSFVRGAPDVLSPGERTLWRQVGTRIGYDLATLDEYVPLPATPASIDPIRQAALQKVAIVSLREPQVQEAARLLQERCEAHIVIVSETSPRAATASALSADVILFVWSATTHAVFRAFDAVDKQRFAYVQGTGAASIVMALERWVASRV